MSDMDTIRERIKKLMAVAGDGVATEGEIDNAMRLAAKLLDAHHLTMDDIGASGEEAEATMGRSYATSQSTKFSTWESALAWAVVKLFGCVQHYITHETGPIRVNGIAQVEGGEVRRGKKLCFYGSAVEAEEASQLFAEWARSIATMGVARWGGCFRGDGAKYCYGFAVALLNKATEIDKERALIQAKPIALIAGKATAAPVGTTAITLANRYDILKDAGKEWLKEECKINLGSAGRRAGYRAGSNEAYSEGRAHGAAASFGRNAKRRQLPG